MNAGQLFSAGLVLVVLVAAPTIHMFGDLGGRLAFGSRHELQPKPTSDSSQAFPRRVTDDYGDLTIISVPPRRIVSSEMTVDRILCDLVAPRQIVAVSRCCFERRYSNFAERVTKLGRPSSESAEVVLSFRPRYATSHPRILGYDRRLASSYGVNTLFHDVVTLRGGINMGAERGLDTYDRISFEQKANWIVTGGRPGSHRGSQADAARESSCGGDLGHSCRQAFESTSERIPVDGAQGC